MQDEGVLIQPYWRSLFRHADPKVRRRDASDLRASPLQVVAGLRAGAPPGAGGACAPFSPIPPHPPARQTGRMSHAFFPAAPIGVMILTALCLTFVVFYLTNLPPNLEKLAKSEGFGPDDR
jgi:hypothetical protein